jgi:DNA-binding MarR family transcriptional regulator
MTLFIIHSCGDVPTLTEISRLEFRKPHTISNIVARMEKRGLVRKFAYLNAKNLVRVAMTDKG